MIWLDNLSYSQYPYLLQATKSNKKNVQTKRRIGLDLYDMSFFFSFLVFVSKLFSCCLISDGSKILTNIEVLTFGFHFMLQSDVNTVCFADETSHLIYSGSDDSFCKVCSTPYNVFFFLFFLSRYYVLCP